VGFPCRENEFPFLNPGEPGAFEKMAKRMVAGTGQTAIAMNMTRDGTRIKETGKYALLDVDVLLGVGWFFNHSMKLKHQDISKSSTNAVANIRVGEWDNGLFWPRGLHRYPRPPISERTESYIPFLVGYSGEAYGGGSCHGLDVMIDAGGAHDPRKKRPRGCTVVFALSALRTMMSRNNHATEHLVLANPPPRVSMQGKKIRRVSCEAMLPQPIHGASQCSPRIFRYFVGIQASYCSSKPSRGGVSGYARNYRLRHQEECYAVSLGCGCGDL